MDDFHLRDGSAHRASVVDISPHFTKINLHGSGMSVHRFNGADGPHCLPHDHPFRMEIEILRGGYVEQIFAYDGTSHRVERREGDVFVNEASRIHRILHLTAPEVWTAVWLGQPERQPGEYDFRPDGPYRREFGGDWTPFNPEDF